MNNPTVEQIINPAKHLTIAVSFKGKGGSPGPVACNRDGIEHNGAPTTPQRKKAITYLKKMGFDISAQGTMSISIRGTRREFEKLFNAELVKESRSETLGTMSMTRNFFVPKQIPDDQWERNEKLYDLIDDAYIQWPHIYMNQRFDRMLPSPLPPQTPDFSLSPSDVAMLLGAEKAHRQGFTGKGIKVAMIDSGFAQKHPYFVERGYKTATVLAPDATEPDEDANGHGTGESANLLAMAPDVDFVGVKLDHGKDPARGASILEGIQTALQHNPKVISVSLGFDLRAPSGLPMTTLPNSLAALQAEIRAAVGNGIIVVFSAGNGHISFPGMMPEVISAGGVFVDPFGGMEASDYASAFTSKIYSGRKVPDFSGLVGRAANSANYITLPIPPHCEIDRSNATIDGTDPNSGWGAFSGTSASAPQIAGACALLLEKDPSLSADDLRGALATTARTVKFGNANPASNPSGRPLTGKAATGSGLIDVSKALGKI